MGTSGATARRVVGLLLGAVALLAACSSDDTSSGGRRGPYTIAIIGDSYTEGTPTGGQGEANWTARLRDRLRGDGYRADLVVGAGSGSGYISPGWRNMTFQQMAERSVPEDADLVIVFGSINDAMTGVTMDQLAEKAEAFDSWVREHAPDATLMVVGPSGTGVPVPPEIEDIRDTLESTAEDAGADFVDPIDEEWFTGKNADLIGLDGIHPTDDGHEYMARQLAPHVEDALDARDQPDTGS